ncbi:hypothetical protein AAFC00_006965 [Neodothiora populina]|uniref:Spindle pole body component n=1 Tax=Neodothiora populina TaxID=2781224 RepID=A0ABR3PBV8_9PEZI
MLHEVLLALSGHPSPLFPAGIEDKYSIDSDTLLLSPSETAQLERVGKLAFLHSQIRAKAEHITAEHPSLICKVVASSLLHTHLARFQKNILDVEEKILTKDTHIVGAYNIVPLSAVAGEFDQWRRRMEWYWNLVCYIQGPKRDAPGMGATGALLIDHLRNESQTGFPDIESVSVELSRIAEKVWLKQLTVWLLYGEIPSHGAGDFFVTVLEHKDVEGPDAYSAKHELLPKFVSHVTTGSLLFIGNSIHQVKQQRKGYGQLSAAEKAADIRLVAEHLQVLSSLTLPLVSSAFSTAVTQIRSSLSRKVLQKLLPIRDIEVSLRSLREFFLLGRGEFAMALIWEAHAQVNARQGDLGRFLQDNPTKHLQGVLIKDGEVKETLERTWKILNLAQSEDVDDYVLEFARANIRLETVKSGSDIRPPQHLMDEVMSLAQPADVAFDDLLFPVRTSLSMTIGPPLDLFLSRADVTRYASINAYLVALRRCHTRLSDLWRLSPTRREEAKASRSARQRLQRRVAAMRKVWATCSAAVFLLSETTAYLEGEVIKSSWDEFFRWAIKGGTTTSAESTAPAGHDPESLSSAHRLYLSSLTYSLLLTDLKYTRHLRGLFANIDHLIAHFHHLQHLQRALDMDAESGITSKYAIEEEQSVTLELDRARKRVDGGMKDVVERLRQLDDDERLGEGLFRGLKVEDYAGGDGGSGGGGKGNEGDEEQGLEGTSAAAAFEPWRGGGVERLLMKLDFGRVTSDEV